MGYILQKFLNLQRRFDWLFLLVGILLAVLTYPRAISLLSHISTDIIHLLPDDYPSVKHSNEIKEIFNKRSSMILVLSSPDPEMNLRAMHYIKKKLEENDQVQFVDNEKKGFDFINTNKLLLVDLADLYTTRDRLKETIQKKKLGGLYIDFEEDDSSVGENFADVAKRYKEKFLNGVNSRYMTNDNGKVYQLSIFPKNLDNGLKFFKKFGEDISLYVDSLELNKQFPGLEWGYAGGIRTRVDEFQSITDDLKVAGAISGALIFLTLFLHFRNIISVILVFLPMIISTFVSFWFCSFFFTQLNIITSFLFSIIFGLGVDIGIHLLTRYKQDRRRGVSIHEAHADIVSKTGKTVFTSVLTTSTSFYVLALFDFKGFSDFGWIAGNGLITALLIYIIFFPPIILLAERLRLFNSSSVGAESKGILRQGRRLHLPRAGWVTLTIICCSVIFLSLVLFYPRMQVSFEYDFANLKMKIPERQAVKAKLRQTSGRVNSPAYYLVDSDVEARAIKKEIELRRDKNPNETTIEFFRSYYDLFPLDQDERFHVIHEIEKLLDDDALNVLKKDEREVIDDLKKDIAGLKKLKESDITADMKELFWGNTGQNKRFVAFVTPKSHLEMDNGKNAMQFYDEVHQVQALGKTYYGISDSIVFADMLKTLFRDSGRAIFLSAFILVLMISIHFKEVKRTLIVVAGLAFGVLSLFFTMGVFGLKLNFYNMIVIPTIIGMGEDNSVHVMDRFDEMKRRSILDVLRTTGPAALQASLSTIFGYAGLCFTHHPGLRSIGILSMIGMVTCLMGSLVFLPFMAQFFLSKDKNLSVK